MGQAPQNRRRQGGSVVLNFVSAAGHRIRFPAVIFSDRLKVIETRSLGILASSLCLLAQLQVSGCSKTNQKPSDINFVYESQPNPPHIGSNIFVVKLNDKNGAALTGASVTLEGDMSHPGMSPATAELKEVDAGTYRGELNLAMRGDWVLEFHIALSDGRKLDREVELRNVKE
jgi:hypothetical protein